MLLFWPCLWGLTMAQQFSDNYYLYFKHCLLFLLFLLFALLSGDWVSADQNELVAKISELDVNQSIVVFRSKKMADVALYLPDDSVIYLVDGSIGTIEQLQLDRYVLVFGDFEQGVLYQLNVLK